MVERILSTETITENDKAQRNDALGGDIMPKYDERDIVEAIRALRDMMYELIDFLGEDVKEGKKVKLKKLGVKIKKIELTRR